MGDVFPKDVNSILGLLGKAKTNAYHSKHSGNITCDVFQISCTVKIK